MYYKYCSLVPKTVCQATFHVIYSVTSKIHKEFINSLLRKSRKAKPAIFALTFFGHTKYEKFTFSTIQILHKFFPGAM